MTKQQQILEIKEKLSGTRHEFLCDLVYVDQEKAIVCYKLARDYQVEDLSLSAGTLSYGYFWCNRHYNVYHWVSPTGVSLGLYVNICDQTIITAEQIYWRDLEVDLLIRTSGRCTILDEDEVPDDLAPGIRQLISKTTQAVSAEAASLLAEIETATRFFIKDEQIVRLRKHAHPNAISPQPL